MVNLADFFPDSIKQDFSDRNFQIGSVIKIYDEFAEKYKFHIIVGFDKTRISTASVRINSEKNKNVFRTDYLKTLCVTLKVDVYDFLNHDSIIDCTKVIEWETNRLKSLLSADPEIHKGNLSQKDVDNVRSILATAKTIEPKKRKKFGLQ